MLKNIFLGTVDIFLNRRRVIRLSKAMLNRALGDNNGDMKTNGEFFYFVRFCVFKEIRKIKLLSFLM